MASESEAPSKTKRALLIIDVQNDFCSGGSLAVPDGDATVPVINELRKKSWDMVVLTQDWHPSDHISFASNNEGAKVFEARELPDIGTQVMWPNHCVQESKGAEFHPDLVVADTDVVVRKGTVKGVDSYSGFGDAFEGKWEKTELCEVLTKAGIKEVYCVGLATDFCVSFTAKDAKKNGFETTVVVDGARGISEEGIAKEREQWATLGVKTCDAADVE